jgi:hypothetical protein
MAIVSSDYLRPARRLGLNANPVMTGPEAASQTFVKGDVLINSSGYLAQASADPVANIVGVAIEDGHNDSSAGTSDIKYTPAIPGMIFKGVVHNASSASLAVIAATDRFTRYGLARSSTANVWYIDKTESSSAKKTVTIVDFDEAVSTTNGTVYFVFNTINTATTPFNIFG